MSEHDEFCPMQHGDGLCRCYILRKARVDERARVLTEKGIEAAVQQERHRAEIEATRADEREKIAAAIEKRLKEMHSDLSNPRYEEAIRIARSGGGDE